MYRETRRRCPGCDSVAEIWRVEMGERVELERCVACDAFLIDFFDGELVSVAKALRRRGAGEDLAWTELNKDVQEVVPKVFQCPDCTMEMEPYSLGASQPWMRRCPGCLLLFVEADKLRALSTFDYKAADDEESTPRWWRALLSALGLADSSE